MRNLIKYKIIISLLSLFFCSFSLSIAQDTETNKGISISGKVVDADNQAISEANVSVVDEFNQIRTNLDGTFTIVIKQSYLLTINKEGYQTQTYSITPSIDPIITLEKITHAQLIDVAYGQRTKTELTHAISSMRSKELSKSPVPNLGKAIPGYMTGLTVLKNSGDEPGYDGSSFYIRGIGTFGGAKAPLILVDNVERDFTQLDPEEIESITVLKDAAATVLYGMEAANGVISVVTKRGNIGKPSIKFVAQGGFQEPTRIPDYLGSKDYLTAYQKAYNNDYGYDRAGDKYNPDNYSSSANPYLYPDVDWHDEFLEDHTLQQQYKLSIAGGTNVARYYILGGYMEQGGLYKHTNENPQYNTNVNYKRFNFRSNMDVNITKNLLVSLDIAARIENRKMPVSSAATIFSTLSSTPSNAYPITNADGSLAGTSEYQNNPLGLVSKKGYREHFSRFLQGNFKARYDFSDIIKGLSGDVMYSYDANNNYNVGRTQTYAVYEYLSTTDNYIKYGEDTDIDLYLNNYGASLNYRSTLITGLSYHNLLGIHKIDADLKYKQYKYDQNGNYIAKASQGIFSRMTYGYDSRYIAELGLSYNGSENFTEDNRYKFFPALSGAWIISNESFLKENKAIDFFKLRASYGIVGNNNMGIDRFAFEQQYSTGLGYPFGNPPADSDGASEGRLGNENISCEISKNLNFGMDFEALNILSLSIDWFRNDRNDIITTRDNTFPDIFGQSLPYENIGSVLNTGFEVAVGIHKNIKDFSYYAKANISYAHNEITDYPETQGLEDYQKQTGKSVGSYWGVKHLGFFENQAEIDAAPLQQFSNVQPGDVKYVDKNNDGFINEEDNQHLGNAIPEWTFGFILGAEYKGFDINAVIHGVSGRSVILYNNTVWSLTGNGNATDAVYKAWGETNNPIYPRLTTLANDNNYRNSSLWLVNGDFFKLSNLEIGYTLSNTITRKFKLSNVRFFVNGYNLLSIDNMEEYGLDPEIPNAGVTGYPDMRVYNLGVSVKFN